MKTFCTPRKDIQHLGLPYGSEGKHTNPMNKRQRYKCRWSNDDVFEIFINGRWEEANSIDFDF